MQRVPKLPCLPGFNFDTKIGQTKFHRSQVFDKIHDGVYYLSERSSMPAKSRYPSIYPRGEAQALPPWIAFDGQRLMFKAFFQETVQESRWQSAFQQRVVTISFFLEDGTIKIAEPTVDNSGLEQGVLVRRQRIPMPDPVKYRYYDIIDLNVGKEPEIFGRVYKIVDCDKFTRIFLNRMGIPVPDPIEIPNDPYNDKRQPAVYPKKPNRRIDTLGKFLKYDRKVLRFYGYWDDTESEFGTIHELEVHYYLADDTIEIKENAASPISGRASSFVFIKRMKIPKFYTSLEAGNIGVSGDSPNITVLNVLSDSSTSRPYYMLDSLSTGNQMTSDRYYKENDIVIGAQLNVFGRKLVITDLDGFTKEYYRTKYGIDDFKPLEMPDSENTLFTTEKYVPPYNGFGSYDDSLGNCFTVTPQPPKPDFLRFQQYDKQGFDSRVLRFRAKMISRIPEYADRQFIIRVYLMDDTVSIFELAPRNTGFQRCLFQKRMQIILPGENIYTNKKPKYYEPQDFYVGARLNLSEFHFLITSADDYALRYMELNSDKFPKANVKLIMDKLRHHLKPVYKDFLAICKPKDPTTGAVIEYRQMRQALCKYLGDEISEHEIITIARRYSSHEKRESHSREYVRRLMHTEITRLLWNQLDRLREDIHHWDRGCTGYLPRNELYTILRGCRIPVDPELVNSMLDNLNKNDEGMVDYRDLLQFMDTKLNPVTPIPPVNIKTSLWWAAEKEPDCGAGLNWDEFLKDLDIREEDCDEASPHSDKY